MGKTNIQISLDIETDGPCAGLNNMLTLGAVAFDEDGTEVDAFYDRLESSPGLSSNPSTLVWWANQNQEARSEAFYMGPRFSADKVMIQLAVWLERLKTNWETNKLTVIAWPAAFDFAFVNYYSYRFLNYNPLGYACLDIRSYVHGVARTRNYLDIKDEKEMEILFGNIESIGRKSHVAIDDARYQGLLYFQVKKFAERNVLVPKIRR